METMENKQVPEVVFKTQDCDQGSSTANVCVDFTWKDLTSSEIFKGKKVVLFALPGAFTPTCSTSHAPGYEKHFDEFKALGVDSVICLSVNDAFVMFKWAQSLEIKNVIMLPDGNKDFTRGMGMLVSKENLGFGERSWRYSMFVEDGLIKKIFSEAGKMDNAANDPFEVSNAETMLAYLKELGN